MTIRKLMQNHKPLVSVRVDQTAFDAVVQMTGAGVGAVLVLDEAGKIVGIFTERDCMQKVTRAGLDPKATPVQSVMTSNVRYAKLDQPIEECMRLMTERHFRHLPVLDDQQQILGIVSIGDLVKARLVEQEFVIGQMENYISDSLPVNR